MRVRRDTEQCESFDLYEAGMSNGLQMIHGLVLFIRVLAQPKPLGIRNEEEVRRRYSATTVDQKSKKIIQKTRT